MRKFKINDSVIVKDQGSNKVGKIFEIGRKNKVKVYNVLMESGTVHYFLQMDNPNALYYIDSELSDKIFPG